LSLRRTQPEENVIADIVQCGWILASHKCHGDECSNATCVGGYAVPEGHENCTRMRHEGVCKPCPTEYAIEMRPHWEKEDRVLEIWVWQDLSCPSSSPSRFSNDEAQIMRNSRPEVGHLQGLWLQSAQGSHAQPEHKKNKCRA
jgi:hypothetical protein